MNLRTAVMLPVLAFLVASAFVAAALSMRNNEAPVSVTSSGEESGEVEDAPRVGAPRLQPGANVCQGILHRPDAKAERVFPAVYTKRVQAAGLTIVANGNVADEALEKARVSVERMFRDNDLERVLGDEGAYVVIADETQGVLDLPEFACLSDTENDELFSHVCGIADRADYPVVTVNELDLLGDRDGPCGGLNILYHELGHQVQGWSLDPSDYFDIKQLYQDAMNAGKYRGQYASTNANEYFADATQAYFDSAEPDGRHDAEWLAEYDPAVFELLERAYSGR